MDLKVFALGAICGAAAFAAVDSFVDSADPVEAGAAQAAVAPALPEPDSPSQDAPEIPTDSRSIESGASVPDPTEQLADVSWGYKMEQTLQQYFAGHDHAAKFEIVGLRCQAALCEIQAVAPNKAAVPAWQQILYDMRQQPWHEFRQTGGWSSTQNGGLKTLVTLHRVDSGDDLSIDNID